MHRTRRTRPAPDEATTVSLAAIAGTLPDIVLAVVFLLTWTVPRIFGDQMVRWLFLVALMELIVIQSAGLMGVVAIANTNRAVRSTAILALGGFYTLFAGSISIGMASWWPLIGFWLLTLNRLLGVILGQVPDEQTKALVVRGWTTGVITYLTGLFVVMLLPVPPLGLAPGYVAVHEIAGGALWRGEPQRLMAFGIFYYGLTAWSEVADHWWPLRVLFTRTARTRPN